MNIWVLFWSRSVEHDVSITSAFAIMKKLEKIQGYNIFPIYITKNGKWIYDQKLKDIRNFKDLEKLDINNEFLIDFSKKDKLHIFQWNRWFFSKNEKIIIDVVFPVFHWLNWEDGTIQWLCEVLQVPYVSPSVIGCSSWMNKVIMKNLFKSLWLPIVKHSCYTTRNMNIEEILGNFEFPVFVKPANLWSSIWVSKASGKDELENAIEIAFHYDNEIIIEECVQNLIELNCSAMEKWNEVIASLVEQPVANASFLTFEEKYTSIEWATMQWAENKVKIPADISEKMTKVIQKMTKEIYESFKCEWWAPRVDYLYNKESEKIYVNEVNMIPWALQMHLWEKTWINGELFLETLIKTSIEKKEKRKVNIDFSSNIIDYTLTFINK